LPERIAQGGKSSLVGFELHAGDQLHRLIMLQNGEKGIPPTTKPWASAGIFLTAETSSEPARPATRFFPTNPIPKTDASAKGRPHVPRA
jgi:hypothetical protein